MFGRIICVVTFLISFIGFTLAVYYMIFDKWFVVRLMMYLFFGTIMMITGKLLPKSLRPITRPILLIMALVCVGMCVYGIVLIISFIGNMDFLRLIKGCLMIVYGVPAFTLYGSAQNYDA